MPQKQPRQDMRLEVENQANAAVKSSPCVDIGTHVKTLTLRAVKWCRGPNAPHMEEVLQPPRRDAGIDERRYAVWQLPDGVAQQVEQCEGGERDGCLQLVAL